MYLFLIWVVQPCIVIRNWHASTFCVFVAYSFFCAILFSCVILIGYCWRSEIKAVIDRLKQKMNIVLFLNNDVTADTKRKVMYHLVRFAQDICLPVSLSKSNEVFCMM